MHHYGLINGFAGCWMLEPVCSSRCLTWPLTQLLSAKIWADPRVVFMAKMPFGQYTRQTLFCIITPCMVVILAKKVQGKGSKVCIVMSERNKYGLRVQLSTWRMVQTPKSKAVCTKEGSWGVGMSILLLYEQNKSCSDLELTVSVFSVECGAGLRYSYRHRIICHRFVCVLEEQVTTRKGNLNESPIFGDCRCLSKYTSSPLSLLET